MPDKEGSSPCAQGIKLFLSSREHTSNGNDRHSQHAAQDATYHQLHRLSSVYLTATVASWVRRLLYKMYKNWWEKRLFIPSKMWSWYVCWNQWSTRELYLKYYIKYLGTIFENTLPFPSRSHWLRSTHFSDRAHHFSLGSFIFIFREMTACPNILFINGQMNNQCALFGKDLLLL